MAQTDRSDIIGLAHCSSARPSRPPTISRYTTEACTARYHLIPPIKESVITVPACGRKEERRRRQGLFLLATYNSAHDLLSPVGKIIKSSSISLKPQGLPKAVVEAVRRISTVDYSEDILEDLEIDSDILSAGLLQASDSHSLCAPPAHRSD